MVKKGDFIKAFLKKGKFAGREASPFAGRDSEEVTEVNPGGGFKSQPGWIGTKFSKYDLDEWDIVIVPAPIESFAKTTDGREKCEMAGLRPDPEKKNAGVIRMNAIHLGQEHGYLTISLLQRKLNLGYTEAYDTVEELKIEDIVGPPGSTDSRDPCRRKFYPENVPQESV